MDEIVVFNPLTEDNYADIAHLMLSEMIEPLAEKEITFTFDREAEKVIAGIAYNDKYGARDIRRVIRREVEDKIADLIIDSDDRNIRSINVSAADGKIVLTSTFE